MYYLLIDMETLKLNISQEKKNWSVIICLTSSWQRPLCLTVWADFSSPVQKFSFFWELFLSETVIQHSYVGYSEMPYNHVVAVTDLSLGR